MTSTVGPTPNVDGVKKLLEDSMRRDSVPAAEGLFTLESLDPSTLHAFAVLLPVWEQGFRALVDAARAAGANHSLMPGDRVPSSTFSQQITEAVICAAQALRGAS